MKRQGLNVTPKQLMNLATQLMIECAILDSQLGLVGNVNENQGFLIPIVNKSNCSDTWEIERPKHVIRYNKREKNDKRTKSC